MWNFQYVVALRKAISFYWVWDIVVLQGFSCIMAFQLQYHLFRSKKFVHAGDFQTFSILPFGCHTSHEIFPPWFRKYQNTLENSLGTCPTIVPSALRTATARRSWVFPASLPIQRISPTRGVHTSLNTWWPRITLSLRRMESSDFTSVLAISNNW